MADIAHVAGGDLIASPTNDLATVDGAELGRQRVLRRLMTVPGTYIYHPDYGAGLPLMIGSPPDANAITGVVLAQMRLETCVAASPPPAVSVVVNPPDGVTLSIFYTDASTGQGMAIGPLTF